MRREITGDSSVRPRGNHADFHAEYGEIQPRRSAALVANRVLSAIYFGVRVDQRAERDVGGRVIPRSTAQAASCVRELNPSLPRALAT